METAERVERQGRPWAQGIGLLLLGLAVAALSNALTLQADPGPALRPLSLAAYAAGVVVSGAGIHRMLWVGPSEKRGLRLFVTALVTIPAFAATALLLALLFTIVQLRFST